MEGYFRYWGMRGRMAMDIKEPIAHVAADGRVHGLEEHLRGHGQEISGVY